METVLAWSYKLTFNEFEELVSAVSYIRREINMVDIKEENMNIQAWDVEKLLSMIPGDCYTVQLLKGDGESEWIEYDNADQVPESLRQRRLESFKMFVGAQSALYIIYS